VSKQLPAIISVPKKNRHYRKKRREYYTWLEYCLLPFVPGSNRSKGLKDLTLAD
jgi:hypothetical protein